MDTSIDYTKAPKYLLFILLLFCLGHLSFSQCPNPTLYDLNLGNPSAAPVWVNCIDNQSDPNSFTLNLLSPNAIQSYSVNWGDGSPASTGTLLPAGTALPHTYVNLGTYTVRLSETQNGCTKTITGKLTSDRKPGASALPPTLGANGCVPHSLTFINQSTNPSPFTQYEWNWGDGTIQVVGPATVGQPITHTYVKGKAGCGMGVRLTAMSLCDTSYSTYGPYDFWDIDTAAVRASATKLCNGDFVTFTDVTKYNCNVKTPRKIRWDFRQVGGPLTSWLDDIPVNRSQTYFISGPVGSSYTVFLADSNFCGVANSSVTVQIIAPPDAIIQIPNPTICAGQNGTMANATTGAPDTYSWNYGDGSGWFNTTSKATVQHKYNLPGTYTVKLVASISSGRLCTDTATATITVLPASISDFKMDTTSGCGSATITFTDLSTGAVSWSWDFGAFGTFSGQRPAPVTFTGPGTYQVKLTTSNSISCGSVKTSTVTIYPTVTATMNAAPVCLGSPSVFSDRSTLPSIPCATGNILREQWDNINGTAVINLTSNANYPAKPSSSSLLTSFESLQNAGDNYGARVRGFICPPTTGNYVFYISGDDDAELWLSADANPANRVKIASVTGFTTSREWTKYTSQKSGIVPLVAGQKYYIDALHKESGGGDNLAVGWQVPGAGTAINVIAGTYLSPFVEGNGITSWRWNFGDGTTSRLQNPVHTYASPGAYSVVLTASTGKCSDTKTFPYLVYPASVADFTLSSISGCTPLNITIINKSTGAAKYYWDYGDGSPFETVIGNARDTIHHTFFNYTSNNSNFTITLVSESANGCRDTIQKTITVFPGPVAGFSFNPSVPQCSPSAITFTNLSIGASTYLWNFGDGQTSTTTSASFIHNFVNRTGAIRYDTVVLKAFAGTGCYGETYKVVVVYPEPAFEIVAFPDTGCHPMNVNFFATGGPTSYKWDFGDGATSTQASPLHNFKNYSSSKDTVYTVRLIGTSIFGCKDTAYKRIVVHPNPSADFIQDISMGCGPLTVNFQNLSTGAVIYTWDFGDGTGSTTNNLSFSHTFNNNTLNSVTYAVMLIAETAAGCKDTAVKTVTIYPNVIASFAPSDSIGCSPLGVGFRNTSSGATNYAWDFGDGSISSQGSPIHIFVNNGNTDAVYLIRLIATSPFGCKDTTTKSIRVHPKPSSGFNMDNNVGCSPLSINMQNTSVGLNNYQWDFGDGTSSNSGDARISHTFTNDLVNSSKYYNVILIAVNAEGCSDSSSHLVTVYPVTRSGFISTDTIGCSPWFVSFQNNSSGATSYLWDFGDGASTGLNNPKHTFVNNGLNDTIYHVRLISRSSYNCSDISYKQIVVHPKPKADFFTNVNSGCSPLDINFHNISTGALGFSWDFGDGSLSTSPDADFVHTFVNPLNITYTYEVKLYVRNAQGCQDTLKQIITVYPKPLAAFDRSDTAACTPFTVLFSNNSVNTFSSIWDFGDGSSSGNSNPYHTFQNFNLNDTIYKVSLIVVSNKGCSDTISKNITVYPRPQPQFTLAPSSINPDDSVSIVNMTQGNWNYKWNFGDGDTSLLKDPLYHSYRLTGNYNVSLTASSDHGCSASVSQHVTVIPLPPTAGMTGSGAGCFSVTVTFHNNSYNANRFVYYFGDGDTLAMDNRNTITHTFVNTGLQPMVFSPVLKATGPGGVDYYTLTDSVTVYPNPEVSFKATPDTVYIPQNSVYFSNLTQIGTSWLWDFGDNSTSTERNPVHLYSDPGHYTVSLTATTSHGCTITKTIPDFVIAREGGRIIMPNAFIPSQGGSNGGNYTSGHVDVFAPGYIANTVDYKLQIFNKWGELLFESFDKDFGWDGYYKGNLCQEDVYVFKVRAKFNDGNYKEMVGDVTLLHK
jgi:gliding motility-associated-like protein